jgi:hypothetical protein
VGNYEAVFQHVTPRSSADSYENFRAGGGVVVCLRHQGIKDYYVKWAAYSCSAWKELVYQTTLIHIPHDSNLHQNHNKDLKQLFEMSLRMIYTYACTKRSNRCLR